MPGYGVPTGQPLKAMGRFSHEACAVDPATGFVYETEDATPGGFYKFEPNQYGNLAAGGKLFAMTVKNQPNFNFSGLNGVYVDFAAGTEFEVEWVPVTDPEAINGRAYNSAPGRACFSRPEGAWYDSGKIYWLSTNGGVAKRGTVYVYDPRRETLTVIFNSLGRGTSSDEVDMPDNLAVSPRGGIILLRRRLGWRRRHPAYARSDDGRRHVHLRREPHDSVRRGYRAGRCGARRWRRRDCLDSCRRLSRSGVGGCVLHHRWMFVNIQTPGITFAITGPGRTARCKHAVSRRKHT